jgi:hypothetical protein
LLTCGDTFLIPETTSGVEHLYIVLTNPEPGTGRAVCVNLTGRQLDSDATVVVNVGEHPFVSKESVVFYQKAKALDMNKVEAALKAKMSRIVCKQHQPCSQAFLSRVQKGLLASKSSPHDVKRYCEQAWGVSQQPTPSTSRHVGSPLTRTIASPPPSLSN